jgi:hypothetical protein
LSLESYSAPVVNFYLSQLHHHCVLVELPAINLSTTFFIEQSIGRAKFGVRVQPADIADLPHITFSTSPLELVDSFSKHAAFWSQARRLSSAHAPVMMHEDGHWASRSP